MLEFTCVQYLWMCTINMCAYCNNNKKKEPFHTHNFEFPTICSNEVISRIKAFLLIFFLPFCLFIERFVCVFVCKILIFTVTFSLVHRHSQNENKLFYFPINLREAQTKRCQSKAGAEVIIGKRKKKLRENEAYVENWMRTRSIYGHAISTTVKK